MRSEVESVLPVCHRMRVPNLLVVMTSPPPASIAPNSVFNVTLVLVDVGADATTASSVLAADHDTTCALSIVSATRMPVAVNGTPLASVDETSNSQVLGGSGVAAGGAVHLSAVTLRAPSGVTARLQLTCKRGDLWVPVSSTPAAVTLASAYVRDGDGGVRGMRAAQLVSNSSDANVDLQPQASLSFDLRLHAWLRVRVADLH
ncbi:hypothetical protein EON66_04090 [archaeon]|nr:MAG: hypothetical protein EON66_04090 [archaeon]